MSYSLRSSLLLLALLTVFAGDGWGQSASSAQRGIRLRVTAPGHGLLNEIGNGRLVDDDTLLLARATTSTLLSLSAIDRLEVSGGNEWSWSRAAVGVGAGMAAGFLFGATADCSGGFVTREGCMALGTVVIGIPMGAVIALFAGFQEVWLPAIPGQSLRAQPVEGRR